MYQVYLLANKLHQSRNLLSKIAIVDRTFTERKRHFLAPCIIDKIGSQSFAKLVDQIVGAKASMRYVLNVCAITACVNTYAVTYSMLHDIVMNGAAKQQPRFVQRPLTRLKSQRS